MNQMTRLRTRTDVESDSKDGTLSEWKERRYAAFDATMTDEDTPFPCYFAVDAHRDNTLRYLFAPSEAIDEGKDVLAEGLTAYLDDARAIGDITALAVFFEPSEESLSLDVYQDRFWELLDYLHHHDPAPWPDEIPTDPADPEWEFCYAGEPIFIVARAPCYDHRHSRYTSYGLEITVQPRWVFDGLSGDTERDSTLAV